MDFCSTGNQLADAVRHFHRVRAGLFLNRDDDSARAVEPTRGLVVLDVIDDGSQLLQPNRRTIAISNDQRPVGGGVGELPGGHHRE